MRSLGIGQGGKLNLIGTHQMAPVMSVAVLGDEGGIAPGRFANPVFADIRQIPQCCTALHLHAAMSENKLAGRGFVYPRRYTDGRNMIADPSVYRW